MEIIVSLVFWSLLGGAVGATIGSKKGRVGAGFFFGFVLGPIGWLVVGLGPNLGPKCPMCKEPIVAGALKCKHCGSALTA